MGVSAALQTTLQHMKRLNKTKSPIFALLCVLCFHGKLLDFYPVFHFRVDP